MRQVPGHHDARLARPLALVGLKHVGKSTIARLLELHWNYRAVDLDAQVLEVARDEGILPSPQPGEPAIRSLYSLVGGDRFRELETAALQCLLTMLSDSEQPDRVVIATGGGIAENLPALDALVGRTHILYLREDPLVLYARVSARGLPAFLDPDRPREHFLELAYSRDAAYRAVADRIVDADRRPSEALAREIATLEQH